MLAPANVFQHFEGIQSSPPRMHHRHHIAHYHCGGSLPYVAAYSQSLGVGHWKSPGTRSEEVEPVEMTYVLIPSEIPGPPVWVAYYCQHYPRSNHGSCQPHPVVGWRELSPVPGAPKESDKPGLHYEIKGGHHPSPKRMHAVRDPSQQNLEKQMYL